jgi:hypothetical protein
LLRRAGQPARTGPSISTSPNISIRAHFIAQELLIYGVMDVERSMPNEGEDCAAHSYLARLPTSCYPTSSSDLTRQSPLLPTLQVQR